MSFIRRSSGRRRGFLFLTPALAAMLVAGCSANPGDAPTVETPTETPAASDATAEPEVDAKLRELSIGVDAFDGNLNPHMTGNLGQATMAVADLTLPSAFNRVGDKWVMNKDLLTKVKPDDEDAPEVVNYTIHPNAQWSDGTPISGSDFQYLHESLRSQRVAESAAQYSHIKSIRVSAGGSKVRVAFDSPQPGWRQLFRHLLPSHIYRSEGQDFARMMDERSVASGGAYRVHDIDAGRGVIELQRNDRYWGSSPAVTDRLVFNTVPDVHTGAQMLRSGQMQMYAAYPNGLTKLTLEQVPELRGAQKQRKVQLNLNINLESPRMKDADLRNGIVKAISPDTVAKIIAGNSQVSAPDWDSPEGEIPKEAKKDFEENKFLIGAPANDAQAVIAARTAADELTKNGIRAAAITVDSRKLLEDLLPEGAVDASVTWGRTPDTATDLANQFACVQPEMIDESLETEKVTQTTEPTETVASDTETPAKETEEKTTSEKKKNAKNFGGNTTGLCDPDVDEALADISTDDEGNDDLSDVINAVQSQAVVLPLLRDEQRFSINPGLNGPNKPLNDWAFDPYSGVFVGGAEWARTLTPEEEENEEPHPAENLSTDTAEPSTL